MKSIFIIDSTDKLENDQALGLIKNSRSASFLFIKKNAHIQNMASKYDNFSVIDICGQYNVLLNISRERIVKFFAELPRKQFTLSHGSKTSFHELFKNDNFSAWWLMNFADKAPDAGGIVNRLFQLDIIKSVLEKNNFDLGLIYSEDKAFASSVRNLLANFKISSFSTTDNSSKSKPASAEFGKLHISSFGKWTSISKNALKLFISKCISAIIVNLVKKSNPNDSIAYNICFHSWYPAHWYNYSEKYFDKYYFDLVEHIYENSEVIKPTYLFKLKWYEKNLTGLLKSFKRLYNSKLNFDFLDRYISIKDILKMYYSCFQMKRRLDSAFKKDISIFKYNEINIFELAYNEFCESFLLDIPYNLILAKALKRYLKRNETIIGFVNFLELYAYARGFISEIKNDETLKRVKMIAFQHSTITKFNLHYNYDEAEIAPHAKHDLNFIPLPDLFILSGSKAFETLNSFKINRNKLVICGTPRYNYMLKYINIAEKKINEKSSTAKILIASVGDYYESIEMISSCLEALCEEKSISITVKMHPMCDISAEINRIFNSNEKFKKLKYEIKNDNIYDLIIKNDILITSNSMVGLEAIVLGSTVVLYGDAFKINLSPLADSLEFNNIICYSNEQFKNTIRNSLNGKVKKIGPELINKLIIENYYSLDGFANERILKTLEGIIVEKN